MATLGLLKMKIFGNKGYGIVISFHHVTKNILLRESYYIVDSVIPLWWLQHFYGTGARYHLKILHQCGKKIKTQSHNILVTNFYVCRSYRGKSGRLAFLHPPLLFLKSIKATDDEANKGHAPLKKRLFVRVNQAPFMNKKINK